MLNQGLSLLFRLALLSMLSGWRTRALASLN
jgi:hypothetical protein